MKVLALCALTGCATTWAASQALDEPKMWDESVREVHVPEPGIVERFTVSLPLTEQAPFALSCSVDQDARDAVYHQAFRYGHRWKTATAIAFVAEGALASLLYFSRRDDQTGDVVAAGYFAADAVVTGALFFAPRKDVYRREDRPVTTHVRSDCPADLVLAIAGAEFRVDADGRLGEVGEAALDEWMQRGAGAIEVRVAGQARELVVGADERCVWRRERHEGACAVTSTRIVRDASTSIIVAAGVLARAG